MITRRRFLGVTGAAAAAGALAFRGAGPSPLWAMGEEDRFGVAWLMVGSLGVPSSRETALRRMLQEVEKRTSVEVDPRAPTIKLSPLMFEHPMLVLGGSGELAPWSVEEVELMRTWLRAGGFLLVDSSEGLSDGPFLRSARRELARVYADQPPTALAPQHVIYKSFYLLKKPYGRLVTSPALEVYQERDRVSVVLSANDMLGAWARDGFGRWEHDVVPGGEGQRELALRMGVNLVMYALCVDYKEDQVHIPFILKRRTWRVE